jgi:hypothetical protein
MIHAFGCKQGSWQLCLGCGARVCACHGTGRGTCPECYWGLLTNYVKTACRCSFANCGEWAVAEGRRGKAYVCVEHARKQGIELRSRDGDGQGLPTVRTQLIARERGIDIG